MVTLLYAPQAGQKTRGQLHNSVNTLGYMIKERVARQINELGHFQLKVVDPIKSGIGVTAIDKYPDYLDQAFI